VAAVFVIGIVAGLVAPLLQRFGRAAGVAMAMGAGIIVAASVAEYVFADPRTGMAAISANRQFDRINLACEIPVVILALLSLRGSRKIFWGGWAIHAGFAAWIVTIVVWLEFFWHW
jgi:hypothetical protein